MTIDVFLVEHNILNITVVSSSGAVNTLSSHESSKRFGRPSEMQFQHGVRLGWLIDSRPDFQRMYEYYLDDNGACDALTTLRERS